MSMIFTASNVPLFLQAQNSHQARMFHLIPHSTWVLFDNLVSSTKNPPKTEKPIKTSSQYQFSIARYSQIFNFSTIQVGDHSIGSKSGSRKLLAIQAVLFSDPTKSRAFHTHMRDRGSAGDPFGIRAISRAHNVRSRDNMGCGLLAEHNARR